MAGSVVLSVIILFQPIISVQKWRANYDGVARCIDVLKVLAKTKGIEVAKVEHFRAQALLLRVWFHFELKRVFNNIPYITRDSQFKRFLTEAVFDAAKDEYWPIPQNAIDQQGSDVLVQNPGC